MPAEPELHRIRCDTRRPESRAIFGEGDRDDANSPDKVQENRIVELVR